MLSDHEESSMEEAGDVASSGEQPGSSADGKQKDDEMSMTPGNTENEAWEMVK
jgi:hypothetical protein